MPIPGLRYVREYIDPETHDRLLTDVEAHEWQVTGTRRVQIYGYGYHHTKGGIYRVGDLPPWVSEIAARLWRERVMPDLPDQMIVNDYPPGTGIFSHVDLDAFDDTIVSMSLGSTCVMEFTDGQSGHMEQLLLEPRSLLVLAGDSRTAWTHGIPARLTDRWMDREFARGRRVSLTFRKMRQTSQLFPP